MGKKFVCESFKKMAHGGDYNPDQWKNYDGIVDEDLRLMELSDCNVMTVGIFAWTMYEKEEGKFDFSYMDMVIDKLSEAGKKVIMATPSGARPAWMAKKYPEVLRVKEDGRRILYSARHNHCLTSPIYREKVKIINELLAKRYADNPAVIGWHLSNEYGGRCYCDLCANEFRAYLKKKFDGNIDKLNEAYWTGFWSHTFTDFDEIDPPGADAIREKCYMGLTMDWDRFCSEQQLDFIKAERDAVKKYAKQPITTNFMDVFGFEDYNYMQMGKELDFISWDNYPEWHKGDEGCLTAASKAAFNHDFMRSVLNKPFYLMESTPSLVNWREVNPLKRPGMHKLSSIQAVAHGSDSVLYFQWRKGRGGSEKFHGAVVDHVGNENTRVFREVSEVGKCLSKLDDVVGSVTESKVLLVFDWENMRAIRAFQGFNNIKKCYSNICREHYYPFWENGVNVDIGNTESDFSKYDIVIMPMLYSLTQETIDKIESYVDGGGVAVATYLLGMVNENDLCYLGGFPANKLKDVFGVWAEETDSFYENQKVTNSIAYGGNYYKAVDMAEIIHANAANEICVYSKDFYKGMPAVTVNEYGKGKAYYIAMRDEKGKFLRAFYKDIIRELNLPCVMGDLALPEGVVAHSRTDDENVYIFIENYSGKKQTLENFAFSGIDMESGETIGEKIELKEYDVKILKQKK